MAFVDQHHAIGDQVGARQFVSDHDDGHAERLLQFQNQVIDPSSDNRIQSRRGLVKEKNLRVHCHGASDRRALLHSTTELRRHVVLKSFEPYLLQLEPQHDLDCGILQLGVLAQRQGHVLANGHRAEQSSSLERHANLLANLLHFLFGDRRDVLAFDPNLTGARFFQTHQRPQQRALPGAGASQNHQRLAALHVKRDTVQNLDLAIAHAHVAEREHVLRIARIGVFHFRCLPLTHEKEQPREDQVHQHDKKNRHHHSPRR